MTTRFLNQRDLLNESVAKDFQIIQGGAGAIGSFVVLALTKMGFGNITVFDNDKMDDHNIANQMLPVASVGKLKVKALSEVVNMFSGLSIGTVPLMLKRMDRTADVLISTVDSMASRKTLFELARYRTRWFIDARMGAQLFRVYCVDNWNNEQVRRYERTLCDDSQAVQERCGQKSIIYTVLGVASVVCNLVRRIAMNIDNPFETVYDYDTGMYFENGRPRTEAETVDLTVEPEEILE